MKRECPECGKNAPPAYEDTYGWMCRECFLNDDLPLTSKEQSVFGDADIEWRNPDAAMV